MGDGAERGNGIKNIFEQLIRGRPEWLKMAFHTTFKMIVDLKIHHKRGNSEQAMGRHVLNRKATDWC